VEGQKVNKLKVYIEHTNIAGKNETFLFKVKSIKLHPDYKKSAIKEIGCDFALLKLDSNIDFDKLGKSKAEQVCLPRPEDKPDSSKCVVIGWGWDKSTFKPSNTEKLLEAPLPIIPQTDCERRGQYNSTVLICAGASIQGGTESGFFGDSGGPLLCPISTGSHSNATLLQ